VYGDAGDLTVTTGTPDHAQYLIKFRFAGAPVHFITGGSDSDAVPSPPMLQEAPASCCIVLRNLAPKEQLLK